MRHLLWIGTCAGLAAAGFLLVATAADAGPPPPKVCTVSSITLGSQAANTDDSVSAGDQESVTGAVNQSGSAGSGCVAGTAGTGVIVGTKLAVERTDPVLDTGSTSACSSGTLAEDKAWYGTAPGSWPNGTNHVDGIYDTTGLAGFVVGFRTHYVAGSENFSQSQSPCVDLVINPATITCDDGLVHLYASAASATGSPVPGSTETYSYTMTVQNCTGVNLPAVKVQGGTSGWTTYSGETRECAPPGPGSVATPTKNKATVVTWTTPLDNQQICSITISLLGTIKNGTPIGTELFLSGPWSAAYMLNGASLKSDYTGRVSVEVEAPV